MESTSHDLTSADEMHDLQAVSFMKNCFAPAVTRGDLPVQFNRYSVGYEA